MLVLDVRDAQSFGSAHIEGARNVSITNLSSVIDTTARSMPILIYCYHGFASREYAQIFSDFGFSQVFSLDGGYEAWTTRPSDSDGALDKTLQNWLTANGFPPKDVNAVITNGTTPLMKASHSGHAEIMRMIIAAGANLDVRNADGNNALWLACVGGSIDAMNVLIQAGINIDNYNDNGATPLMYAASTGKAAVVERLLAAGADITPETLDGFSALDMAATVECLTLLRHAARAQGKGPAPRPSLEIKQLNLRA
ncbi:MAG: ankyrin repeat domain-containing protein [Methylocella sp.]